MTAHNTVNGITMTEHRPPVKGVLRGEWGFDGVNVSDWTAARSTVGTINGGLDLAMPGPDTVFGEALAAAVRAGEVEDATVDAAVRRVLRLAARVGILAGAEPAVPDEALPPAVDGEALAREIARRSSVLVRNAPVPAGAQEGASPDSPAGLEGAPREQAALPLDPARLRRLAVIGAAARDARVLGGGSATVFPDHVVSLLDGLTAALDGCAVDWSSGADLRLTLSRRALGVLPLGVVGGYLLAGWLRAQFPAPLGRWSGAVRMPE